MNVYCDGCSFNVSLSVMGRDYSAPSAVQHIRSEVANNNPAADLHIFRLHRNRKVYHRINNSLHRNICQAAEFIPQNNLIPFSLRLTTNHLVLPMLSFLLN